MGPRMLLLEREGAADEGSAINGGLNGQFRLTKCASKALRPKHWEVWDKHLRIICR